jgi:hypothetical protein
MIVHCESCWSRRDPSHPSRSRHPRASGSTRERGAVRRYDPDEVGHCLNCRRPWAAHGCEGACPSGGGARLFENMQRAKQQIMEQRGLFKPTQREAEAAAAGVRRHFAREGAQGPSGDPSATPPGAGTGDPTQSATPLRSQNPMPAEPPENVIAYGERTPGEHGRPPRIRRRFVTRGGELVEVESVERETR